MPLDIAAIKARLADITEGDWEHQVQWDENGKPTSEVHSGNELVACCGSFLDGVFIADAPADLAALIAEVERLRAVLDSSSSALTEIAEDIRRELWLDEQDFRGHKLYDRIMDALPALDGGEVSDG